MSVSSSAAFILAVVASLVTRYVFRAKSTTHGSAGWGKPERSFLHPVSPRIPKGSFVIGARWHKLVIVPRTLALQHGIIIGGSGTGKSRGFFIPTAAYSRDCSFVCTDPKSELWRLTSGLHRYPLRFAPTEPDASECFNWIPLCRNARVAELAARAIVEAGSNGESAKEWIDMETSFLAAIFAHTTTLDEPTPLSAYRLFTRQPIETLIDQLMTSPSEVAQEQAMVFSQTQERMRGSIVPVVAAKLQWMRDPSIARFTSAGTDVPDLRLLKEKPCAMYWCLREQDIERLRPLTSLFFTLLIEQLSNESETSVPVTLQLDEFANIGKISGFPTFISLARGRGISLWLGIQSLGQLEAGYGKANAKTIISNCATKIVLAGADVESAEYFSRALGDSTGRSCSRSHHARFTSLIPTSAGSSQSEVKRPLLTPDELRRLGSDEAIAIIANRRPFKLRKLFYDEAPVSAHAPNLGSARTVDILIRRRELPPLPDALRIRKLAMKK